MGEFDAIRPYHDDEVPAVLQRLLQDRELLQTLAGYRFPRLSRWMPGVSCRLVGGALRRELRGVDTVHGLQQRLEPWLDKVIEKSAPAHVANKGDLADLSPRLETEFGEFRDKNRRQIVHAEEAEIFEAVDRHAFARSGKPGN